MAVDVGAAIRERLDWRLAERDDVSVGKAVGKGEDPDRSGMVPVALLVRWAASSAPSFATKITVIRMSMPDGATSRNSQRLCRPRTD